MGRIKKPFRVYLFTRPPKPKAADQESGTLTPPMTAPVKLRVQVIANGKSHFAVFPLIVRDFSNYFNSDGSFKDGYTAISLKEKFESSCVAAAYQASCRAAEYMLSIDPDYWKFAPTSYFTELVNDEYEDICEGFKKNDCNIARRIKEDKARVAANRVPFWRENLDDWRFAAGVGSQPPQGINSTMDYKEWKNHMKEERKK